MICSTNSSSGASNNYQFCYIKTNNDVNITNFMFHSSIANTDNENRQNAFFEYGNTTLKYNNITRNRCSTHSALTCEQSYIHISYTSFENNTSTSAFVILLGYEETNMFTCNLIGNNAIDDEYGIICLWYGYSQLAIMNSCMLENNKGKTMFTPYGSWKTIIALVNCTFDNGKGNWEGTVKVESTANKSFINNLKGLNNDICFNMNFNGTISKTCICPSKNKFHSRKSIGSIVKILII